jgi:hypothetical protein
MQTYKRATAKELFKIVDDFTKEICVKWPDCVGVCTDATCVTAGNKGGLQVLINHESPAMKELCP